MVSVTMRRGTLDMKNFDWLLTTIASFLSLTTVVLGHGRLIEPPSRSSAYKFGFNTPPNPNDHQLSCGGYWNHWGINHGRCGVCGDPFQGPRENEAGGKYATGTIVRQYSEGQTIDAVVELTVGHGGWSEFRICPNNNVRKPVSQNCLDQHLLATPSGITRIVHQHITGRFIFKLMLPPGLTCSQCVVQWRWNTGSNNNCNYLTNENCCDGCGPQEQFYGCADVSITPQSGSGPLGPLAPLAPLKTTTSLLHPVTVGYTRPGGFLPIDV